MAVDYTKNTPVFQPHSWATRWRWEEITTLLPPTLPCALPVPLPCVLRWRTGDDEGGARLRTARMTTSLRPGRRAGDRLLPAGRVALEFPSREKLQSRALARKATSSPSVWVSQPLATLLANHTLFYTHWNVPKPSPVNVIWGFEM